MAETWDKIQRSVILKANELRADSATSVATAYATVLIGATQLGDRAIEFPFTAINDAILDASGKIVATIGGNPQCPYRSSFQDQTNNISSGGSITELSQSGAPIAGVINTVRDATTNKALEMKPRAVVTGYSNLTLKISPYYYYTDNVRIWHTRTNVVADCCVWDRAAERYWLESTFTRGDCPFPSPLHEVLIAGSLAMLFKDTFNNEQVQMWHTYFADSLLRLEAPKG